MIYILCAIFSSLIDLGLMLATDSLWVLLAAIPLSLIAGVVITLVWDRR